MMKIRGKFYEHINDCTILAQIVGIAVLGALFGIPYWICESMLELKSPYPFYIGITSIITALAFISARTEYLHYRDFHVIRKFEHSIIGLVEQTPVRWWATLSVEGIGANIHIDSNGGPNITKNDSSTVEWILDNID